MRLLTSRLYKSNTHLCTCVSMYACMDICTYVCLYVCMYVYVHDDRGRKISKSYMLIHAHTDRHRHRNRQQTQTYKLNYQQQARNRQSASTEEGLLQVSFPAFREPVLLCRPRMQKSHSKRHKLLVWSICSVHMVLNVDQKMLYLHYWVK